MQYLLLSLNILSKITINYTIRSRKDLAPMYGDDGQDKTVYKVVLNHEELYSIWPVDRENPSGWRNAGKSGSRSKCLAYIKEVWIDMRPLSLRKRMEQ